MRARGFTFVTGLTAMSLLTTLAALPLVAPTTSHADEIDDARAAFERGARLAGEEQWREALAEFETSAKLKPHATTSYNIGYCLRALGRPTRAKKHFAEALRRDDASGGQELSAERRAAAAEYIAEATAKIATASLSIAPADATITFDGSPLEAAGPGHFLAGTRPPGPGEKVPTPDAFTVELDAGPHEIVVATADGRSKVVHEDFLAGASKSLRLEVPIPRPLLAQPRPSDTAAARRTWGFVVGSLGIAGLGAGAYFGLRARSKWNDARDACPGLTQCPDDRGSQLSIDARRMATLSTISFLVGGAATIGGVILVLSGTSTSEPKTALQAGVDAGGGYVGLVGRF